MNILLNFFKIYLWVTSDSFKALVVNSVEFYNNFSNYMDRYSYICIYVFIYKVLYISFLVLSSHFLGVVEERIRTLSEILGCLLIPSSKEGLILLLILIIKAGAYRVPSVSFPDNFLVRHCHHSLFYNSHSATIIKGHVLGKGHNPCLSPGGLTWRHPALCFSQQL